VCSSGYTALNKGITTNDTTGGNGKATETACSLFAISAFGTGNRGKPRTARTVPVPVDIGTARSQLNCLMMMIMMMIMTIIIKFTRCLI
jgi:hypothetical protein